MGIVGDEHHLIFTCPAVDDVREQFPHLFYNVPRSVQAFMWQRDLVCVINFVSLALVAYSTLDV